MSGKRTKSRGATSVGRPADFASGDTGGRGRDVPIDIALSNYHDTVLKRRAAQKDSVVRRITLTGIVNLRTPKLIVPQAVANELGLIEDDQNVLVRYADRKTARRPLAPVFVESCGQHGTFLAIIEPNIDTVIVGYIVITDFDLTVDFEHQRVGPRDPRGAAYEI